MDCSMKQTFLGIDVGTSSMKIVLIDEDKNVLARISEDYEIRLSDKGWREIDPESWYECMEHGLNRILKSHDRSSVAGIGITGQMHTLVVMGEDGKTVRPAMMWNDTRTQDLIPALKERIKHFPEGEYLSRIISTGSPAANLYWLALHEPENFKRIHKFLIGPDYLVYRLTGVYGTDYCEASTSCLYELEGRKWSEEMRKLIGLSKEAYPNVRGAAVAAGNLTEETARRFSLNRGTQVLVGTGDNPATAVSTGCLGRGYPVISLGTSGVLMMPVEKPQDQDCGKVILFSFDDTEYSYLVQGAVQSNGNAFAWAVRMLCGGEDFSRVDSLVDTVSARENEILFYPHLMGEKTMYADPTLRGAFIGLGGETKSGELLYAVMEGLCFAFRELAEKMKLPLKRFGSVKVVGGGARSGMWMQTMANVLNIRVEKMDGMIGSAFGIALLAAWRCGNGDPADAAGIAEKTVKVDQVFEPQEEMAAACEEKYRKYLRIHRALKYIDTGRA